MLGNARSKETRAIQKISKILSRLDRDAAARVASWAAEAFAAGSADETPAEAARHRAAPRPGVTNLRAVDENEIVAEKIKAAEAAKAQPPPEPAPRRISQITASPEQAAPPQPDAAATAPAEADVASGETQTGQATGAKEKPEPAPDTDSDRPSFLQTQFRMQIGKEILEREKDKTRG